MRPVQARFITACQQLLALGVVLAVLTPAAGVMSLDIVGAAPRRRPAVPRSSDRRAALGHRADRRPSSPRSPRSRSPPARATPGRWPARPSSAPRSRANRVTSLPAGRDGLRRRRRHLGRTARRSRRTASSSRSAPARATTWSDWSRPRVPRRPRPRRRQPRRRHVAARHRPADHRRRRRRPGQGGRRRDETALPDDLSLAVVEPGHADATETEAPAAERRPRAPRRPADGPTARRTTTSSRSAPTSEGDISLQAARKAARSRRSSRRAQWGADESIRNKSSPCATARSAPASCTTRSTPTTTPRRRCRASCAASTPTT